MKLAYTAVFGLAALATFVSLPAVGRVTDRDTRRGLAALLVGAGLWAVAEAGRLWTTTRAGAEAYHVAGLLVGFAVVFAWLYFVSAYTGRSVHRDRRARLGAAATFLVVASLKLTNGVHGAYYTLSPATVPFDYVAVSHGPLHWVVAAGAYGLSAVGFAWVYRLFVREWTRTRTLTLLFSVTALPTVATVTGLVTGPGTLLALNYEPVGVAAFAVGALFVVLDSFESALETAAPAPPHDTEAVVLLDADDRVRDANRLARRTFPGVADGEGEPLASVAPALATARAAPTEPHEFDGRQWRLTERPVTLGPHGVGRKLVLSDVTRLRRHATELSRQNTHLDRLTATVAHELRNALAITEGNVDHARRELGAGESAPDGEAPDGDAPDDAAVAEALAALDRADEGTRRLDRVVDDLVVLTRLGRSIRPGDTRRLSLAAVVERVGERAEGPAITVTGDAVVEAEPERLEVLFEYAHAFAARNGAQTLRVDPLPDGLRVCDDGDPVSPGAVDRLFRHGEAAPDAERGLLLPVVKTLARVHGWRVAPAPAHDDGVGYEIREVTVVDASDAADAAGDAAEPPETAGPTPDEDGHGAGGSDPERGVTD